MNLALDLLVHLSPAHCLPLFLGPLLTLPGSEAFGCDYFHCTLIEIHTSHSHSILGKEGSNINLELCLSFRLPMMCDTASRCPCLDIAQCDDNRVTFYNAPALIKCSDYYGRLTSIVPQLLVGCHHIRIQYFWFFDLYAIKHSHN